MSNKKKITLILGVISLLFTMNMVESTYAKYVSRTTTNSKMNIATWDIIVNNKHLKDGGTEIATITPNFDSNENVANGVIAPGSSGYFDINIDPSNTDVSFSYEITVEPAESSNVDYLSLEKYYINKPANMKFAESSTEKITGEILYSETRDIDTVRIYVKWNDTGTHNAADTEDGHNAALTANYTGDIKVSMTFKQIK